MTSPLDCFQPFRHLSARGRARLEAECRVLSVPRGHRFFEEGDPSRFARIVRRGRIQLQHTSGEGRVGTTCVIGGGELFCCLPTLDGGPCPATAVAATDAEILTIPIAVLRDLEEDEAAFRHALQSHVFRKLRLVSCRVSGQSDAGGRLAAAILRMARRFGSDVPLTRRELSEIAGTRVETAIRVIKDFERSGWVRLRRGHVLLVDRTGMSQRAGETPGGRALEERFPD